MENMDKIINFDIHGWPEEKMSIRDILISFGATLENGNWIIPDDPKLETIFPKVVEDDGMGYGVNTEYIISVNLNKDNEYCTIFRDKPLDHLDIWVECGLMPGFIVDVEHRSWMVESIDTVSDELVFITHEWLYTGKEGEPIRMGQQRNFPVEQLKVLEENSKFDTIN